jgi:hypothetical protein
MSVYVRNGLWLDEVVFTMLFVPPQRHHRRAVAACHPTVFATGAAPRRPLTLIAGAADELESEFFGGDDY